MNIWSSSDFPYQCLLDFKRTTALQASILATVRKGDIVLDAGAGSGILSFFAAQAGAKKVYAVEIDPHLAACLSRSVSANGLEDVIEVIKGDIHSATIPTNVDVFICEMMETGLLDEMQVTAINSARERRILTSQTRMIPFQYETFIELGYTNFNYYGFKLFIPKHNWTHYADGNNGWLATAFQSFCDPSRVEMTNLQEPIDPAIDVTLAVKASSSGLVNAIRLSACAHLTKGMILGATNALNGDKVIALDEEVRLEAGQTYRLRVRYRMGEGLNSLQVRVSRD